MLALPPTAVQAWGVQGHQVVANLAQAQAKHVQALLVWSICIPYLDKGKL